MLRVPSLVKLIASEFVPVAPQPTQFLNLFHSSQLSRLPLYLVISVSCCSKQAWIALGQDIMLRRLLDEPLLAIAFNTWILLSGLALIV